MAMALPAGQFCADGAANENLVCGVVAARGAAFGQSERAKHEGGSTVAALFTVVAARSVGRVYRSDQTSPALTSPPQEANLARPRKTLDRTLGGQLLSENSSEGPRISG
jgi:hypothetical protein